jgi:16S rRNA (guanine966-N2)-methyltransferase
VGERPTAASDSLYATNRKGIAVPRFPQRHSSDEDAPKPSVTRPQPTRAKPAALRVIGGTLRHRKILYDGDPTVRPMRDSVRESLFNILFQLTPDALCWDWFAGTGAVAIEAISRGANRSIAIERNRSVASTLQKNVQLLSIDRQVDVIVADSFVALPARMAAERSAEPHRNWVIACCPPYAMFDERPDDIRQLLVCAARHATKNCWIAIECDQHQSPDAWYPDAPWDKRIYGNTRLLVVPLESIAER